MLLFILQTFIILLITIILHEFGHFFAAKACKVKVEYFTIGFWKPYLHKVLFKTDWRITPWLVGGAVSLKGEGKKVKGGFLNLSYRKKLLIVLAGVSINLLISLITYLINYQSIGIGIHNDILMWQASFTGKFDCLSNLIAIDKVNWFLVNLGLINGLTALINLLPFPGLDGSYVWMLGIEKLNPKKFVKRLHKLVKIGSIWLWILQVIFLIWWFLPRGR